MPETSRSRPGPRSLRRVQCVDGASPSRRLERTSQNTSTSELQVQPNSTLRCRLSTVGHGTSTPAFYKKRGFVTNGTTSRPLWLFIRQSLEGVFSEVRQGFIVDSSLPFWVHTGRGAATHFPPRPLIPLPTCGASTPLRRPGPLGPGQSFIHQRRGIGVLGSSHPGSCIDRPCRGEDDL